MLTKLYYDEEKKQKIIEMTRDGHQKMLSPSKSEIWHLYNVLAMQLNELQRLNNTMELIRLSIEDDFLTLNEKRELLGLKPIEGGDVILTKG